MMCLEGTTPDCAWNRRYALSGVLGPINPPLLRYLALNKGGVYGVLEIWQDFEQNTPKIFRLRR